MEEPVYSIIRASEIGQFTYCARAWWLSNVLGYRSANIAAMASGVEAHHRHGRAVEAYHQRRRLAFALLGAAFLIAILLLIVTRTS